MKVHEALAGTVLWLLSAAAVWAQTGRVTLESSDQRLLAGFRWAKQQALQYVFQGDPVGDWYEAALPQRSAFCMRDVSHQSAGAHVLGLAATTANMLRKFAVNIAESRDWCTFWEIDKGNHPAPVDYTSDTDFWYCLPANFDILNCCYRQYMATGDRAYLQDPVFLNYYDRTVSDFVKRWDKDGDGIPKSYPKYGRRGIASYTENLELHALIGGDLIAAEYAALVAYARIQELRGRPSLAREYRQKADSLRALYNEKWWFERKSRFYAAMLQDRSFYDRDPAPPFDLWFAIPEDGPKTDRALDRLTSQSSAGAEELSYVPEIAYRYGRNATAYAALMQLTDPKLERREYPEVSFAVVGAIAQGTMGVNPDASQGFVETLSRLTEETAWATLRNVPVLQNEISVRHVGNKETDFTNESGPPLRWKACFQVATKFLIVDGKPGRSTTGQRVNGQIESDVILTVRPGPNAQSETGKIVNSVHPQRE